ncbi:MAG: dTDP-4-dehydrorhamnose 3,5-epimerase family protein, partial [Flavobacteriaceae bacterium]|nr:dTDP-4-dehydrorhamnose 3,5-epimerase family protein [Flavobacteriaceae bacterium]
FTYKVDQYYNPQSEGSIAPDDPFLNIDWKLDKKNWILSDKDRQHPYIEKARLFDFKEDLYA